MPKSHDFHVILATGTSSQAPEVYTSGALFPHSSTISPSTSKSNANQKELPPFDADYSKPDQLVKFYAAVVAVVSAFVFLINFSVLVVLCRKANRFLAVADAEGDVALEDEDEEDDEEEEQEERETKEENESESESENEDEDAGEEEDKDDDSENGDEEKAKREEKEGSGIEEEDGDDEESSSS